MAEFTVSQIIREEPDSTGATICTVYAKIVPLYAVYQTQERVMVQFADDSALGSEQRLAVGPLGAARAEISGTVDELRGKGDPSSRLRADKIDRALADHLITALQGGAASATAGIEALRLELQSERLSWARFQYLCWACVAAGGIILIAMLMTSQVSYRIANGAYLKDFGILWNAVAAGAVGAFFSIAIAIRGRDLKTELIMRDNIADAVLRVTIGAIGAALLVALIKVDAIGVSIGNAALNENINGLLIPIAAFIAGFSERLVKDLLQTLGKIETASPPATSASKGADERNPRGLVTAGAIAGVGAAVQATTPSAEPSDYDKEEDGCSHGLDGDDASITDNVELPEVIGGMAEHGEPLVSTR